MVKKISLVLLFLFLTVTLSFAVEPLRDIPRQAIDFKLPDLENKIISLSDFKDKVVLLFFWTTWCPYCRIELKNLNDICPQLKKYGLEILTINVGESEARIKSFTRNYYLSCPILLDEQASVASSYGILGIPVFMLIDRKGNIVFNNHYFPEEEYKVLISR